MTRCELRELIENEYSVKPDSPWIEHPNFEVFRHGNNKKWFALIMDIPRNKLGLDGTEPVDVVNFKCDPVLTVSLHKERGLYPAYHMSKSKWITAALDGSADEEIIKMLLDMSYNATKQCEKKTGGNRYE